MIIQQTMKTGYPHLLIAALLISISFSSWTDEALYRWYDSEGVVHFGKKPPRHAEYETLQKNKVNAVSRESDSQYEDEGETEESDEYSEQLDKLAQQQKETCERAKNNKSRLLSSHTIRMKDAEGNVQVLSREEKLEQLKRADEAIKEYCN